MNENEPAACCGRKLVLAGRITFVRYELVNVTEKPCLADIVQRHCF